MCAGCGTRNNPKWEFCVRCGEALDQEVDQELESSEAQPAEAAPQTGGFPWRTVLTLAAAGAVIAVGLMADPVETGRLPLIRLISTEPANARVAPPPAQVPVWLAKLNEGRSLLAQRRPDAALEPLSEAAAAEPENAEAQFAYARALWGTGSREDALSRFELAARFGGGRFRGEYASALLQAERPADARRVLEETIEASPEDAASLEMLGRLHNREGRTAEAAAILSRAAALKPNDPQLIAHLGYALERGGNPERAAELLTGVVASVPDSTIARELLAEAQFKQGKREEAVAVVRQGLEHKPDSPDLHRRLGSLLERAGRAAEAAAAYREYLRLAPQAGDAKSLAERAAYLERGAAPRSGA